jgi:tRNA(Ile2) C34 agmatinyltransferase TiaS
MKMLTLTVDDQFVQVNFDHVLAIKPEGTGTRIIFTGRVEITVQQSYATVVDMIAGDVEYPACPTCGACMETQYYCKQCGRRIKSSVTQFK